jgi:hypothetical protein
MVMADKRSYRILSTDQDYFSDGKYMFKMDIDMKDKKAQLSTYDLNLEEVKLELDATEYDIS